MSVLELIHSTVCHLRPWGKEYVGRWDLELSSLKQGNILILCRLRLWMVAISSKCLANWRKRPLSLIDFLIVFSSCLLWFAFRFKRWFWFYNEWVAKLGESIAKFSWCWRKSEPWKGRSIFKPVDFVWWVQDLLFRNKPTKANIYYIYIIFYICSI